MKYKYFNVWAAIFVGYVPNENLECYLLEVKFMVKPFDLLHLYFNLFDVLRYTLYSPLVAVKPGGKKQRQSCPSTARRRILLAARYMSGLPALEVVNPHFMAHAVNQRNCSSKVKSSIPPNPAPTPHFPSFFIHKSHTNTHNLRRKMKR